MKKFISVLFILVLLLACKTPQKTVSETNVNQKTVVKNDWNEDRSNELSIISDQIMNKIVNELLNITIKQTKYDTNKQADSITGKHPILEENNININRSTNIEESDSIHSVKDSISSTKIEDKSQITEAIKVDTKEVSKIGLSLWQKVLIFVGVLAIILFTIYLILKLK